MSLKYLKMDNDVEARASVEQLEARILTQFQLHHTLSRYNADLALFKQAPFALPAAIALSLCLLTSSLPFYTGMLPMAVATTALVAMLCVLLFDPRLTQSEWIVFSPTLCALAASLRGGAPYVLDALHDGDGALWKRLEHEETQRLKDSRAYDPETCVLRLTLSAIFLLPFYTKQQQRDEDSDSE